MTNNAPDSTVSDAEVPLDDVLDTLYDRDWSDTSDLAVLELDLERFIGSIEQRRAQIQVQGRALTDEEERYLERTDAALAHLREGLAELRG